MMKMIGKVTSQEIREIKAILNVPKATYMTLDGFFTETDKKVKSQLGFVPTSIWEIDWKETKKLKAFCRDEGDSRDDMESVVSYKTTVGNSKNNVSIFNPYLAKMILNAYCPKGAHIYDPFAGGGTRGIIATMMGRKYTGVEIRKNEVDRINKHKAEIGIDFNVIVGDAMEYVNPNKFDFCYTCPPYYDLEQYKGGKNDLSMAKTYNDFLDMIEKVMKNIYQSLKKGSTCVWIIGNFRDKNGELIHFNGDLINIGKRCGFKLHDEIIIHSAPGIASLRSKMFNKDQKSVRIHEYGIVFRK